MQQGESASLVSLSCGEARVFSEQSMSSSYVGLQQQRQIKHQNSIFDLNLTDMPFILPGVLFSLHFVKKFDIKASLCRLK